MSSTQRLNAAEKDLEKFIKFLALKSTQVVVQSRLGEKIQTPCNPLATGNDWFNIVIQDHPDVYAETKRVLNLGPGDSILQRLPLCIEISLKTIEGDQMVLEVWSLDLQTTNCQQLKEKDEKNEILTKCVTNGGSATTNPASTEQQTLKAAHAIYNRMGILLKSLISLTRATPAYKLSRRQCADSYGIYYRIYIDCPQVHTLGEGHKQVKIGQLNTIVGALSMSVAYRTKMTITPTATHRRNGENNTIMLKSDHFRTNDMIPAQQDKNGLKKCGLGPNGERKIIDIEKPLRPGAFVDICKLRQYTEEDYVLPETPPFEWLLRGTRDSDSCSAGCGSIESLNRKSDSHSASPLGNGHQHNINNNISAACNNNINNISNANAVCNNNYNNNSMAFKSYENDENFKKTGTPSTLSHSPIKSLLIPIPPAKNHGSAPSLTPADDDNLLKELNFPFASPNSHVNDLAKFYRDCYHAPPLRGLSELQVETGGCSAAANATTNNADANAVDDLSRQLELFETSLEDYDKLVSQLGLTASSSTGSRSSGGGLQMSN